MNSGYWLLSASIVTVLAFALLRLPGEPDATAAGITVPGGAGSLSLRGESSGYRQAAAAPAASDVSAAQDVQALMVQIKDLRSELEALKRRDQSPDSSQPGDTEFSVEEKRQQEQERTMQTTAFLESNLQRQAKDPSWSLGAEQQVSATFHSEEVAAGSRLQQLSCQATLCRIASQHVDADAERAFMTQLGRLDAFGDAEAFSQRNERPDGSVEIVTYVTRSGHRLPPME